MSELIEVLKTVNQNLVVCIDDWFEGSAEPSEKEAENIKIVKMEYINKKNEIINDHFLMLANSGIHE